MYPGSPVPICSCHFCGHLLVCFQFRWTQIFILLGYREGHHLQSISNHSTELDEEEKVQENGQHVYWPQPTSWNLFLSLVEPIFFRFVGGFWPKPQHMKFPGQGSNSSHSCGLCHSCSNARSLIHCATWELPGLWVLEAKRIQSFDNLGLLKFYCP